MGELSLDVRANKICCPHARVSFKIAARSNELVAKLSPTENQKKKKKKRKKKKKKRLHQQQGIMDG